MCASYVLWHMCSKCDVLRVHFIASMSAAALAPVPESLPPSSASSLPSQIDRLVRLWLPCQAVRHQNPVRQVPAHPRVHNPLSRNAVLLLSMRRTCGGRCCSPASRRRRHPLLPRCLSQQGSGSDWIVLEPDAGRPELCRRTWLMQKRRSRTPAPRTCSLCIFQHKMARFRLF